MTSAIRISRSKFQKCILTKTTTSAMMTKPALYYSRNIIGTHTVRLHRPLTLQCQARLYNTHSLKSSSSCFKYHRPICWRNGTLHLSFITGSYGLFCYWTGNNKRIYYFDRLYVSIDDDDDDDETSQNKIYMACSPTLVGTTKPESLLDIVMKFLKLWWKRLRRFVLVTTRSTEVIIRFSPLLILTPTAIISVQIFNSTLMSDIAWGYTIYAIQALGPVSIKFFQWAATRRDIFPPTLCSRLSILHDRGYPHSYEWTKQVLTDAFGDYQNKGLTIDKVIGCGSAAQVYKGKLRIETHDDTYDDDDNEEENSNTNQYREVAIKILHPRFQESVNRDLLFIQTMAEFFDSLPFDYFKMLNLPRAVEEFSVVLKDQADLTIEANNLRRFRTNFYKKSKKTEEQSSIVFPRPIDGWVSSKAMVEDYVGNAAPIADFLLDSSEEGMKVRKELAGPLLRAFLKMVFMDNFVHGDLHPGNVMVRTSTVPVETSIWSYFFNKDSSSRNFDEDQPEEMKIKRSIVFLDAGIAVSLGPNDQKNLIDLFRAVIFNDGNRAGRLMVERAKHERCSQVEGCVDAFSDGIADIVSEFHDRRKEGLTLGAVRIGVLLSRVLDLCRVHGVEIDPAMASVVISTLVLEGLGRSLSPDLDLLSFAKPFVIGRGKV